MFVGVFALFFVVNPTYLQGQAYYGPTEPINREQAEKMVVEAFELPEASSPWQVAHSSNSSAARSSAVAKDAPPTAIPKLMASATAVPILLDNDITTPWFAPHTTSRPRSIAHRAHRRCP